ncbi:MAG: thioredoxin family protein [Planctomycetaceae bacterium]|nr:thioredoxin family protein [Planctomycetales bacterium]MCB9875039.1 thioredoxin family protein [Planctomycetaceae bacterium]MCB9940096.1 thioredoxin family protein [Planctomycetaceae bacterium]
MSRVIAILLLLTITAKAHTGEYNPVLSIGDPAPTWSDLPGTDGKTHSLSDLKESKAIVLVFTCNSCPYAVDYEERIIALTKQFAEQGVAVVAVNVNKVPEDSLDEMKSRADSQGFNFAYLYDESQQIARDYGATYTPEFFVLDGDRKIAYMGALDDSPAADKVQQQYVAAALNALLEGKQPAVTETVAIGCRIRLERKRRGR